MALQTTTLTCNGSKKHHKFTLTVNEDSTSISDNTSTISFAFTISPINTGWNWASHSTIKYSVNINGQPYTGTILNYNGSSTVTLTSGTQVVAHDSSGSKSIDISFSVTDTSGASYTCGNASASGTMTLTNIARASSLTLSATSVNVGGSITATITRANSNFTHKVEFYINSTYYQSYTGVATSQSFTIPDSWYNYMSSSTSCTAYCRITTYNGNTVIGSTVQKSFAVNVPSTIKPVLGSITLDPTDINGQNILVKSKNALTINVSGCSAGVGSAIKSYTFSGPSVSHTVNTTATSASASIAYISSVGALTYTVTVTDTRGRTASGSAAILCYDYYAPSFTSFNAYRADSNGNANAEGTYLKCVYAINYASVNDTNSATVTLRYTSSEESQVIEMSDGSALIDLGNNTASYQVNATVTDLYGGSAPSSELTILGDFRILNITSDGTGLAIGKMAESANLLDVVPPARFRNSVTFDDPPIGEKTTLWYASQHPAPNDLLNVMLNGDYSADNMQFGYIATENASSLVNSPITSGAFYATRSVEYYPVGHVCVRLYETYPSNGRIWSNMYNTSYARWMGWTTNSTQNIDASAITSGTLPIARGGTGVTSNPSMLTNLGSTTAASVFAASPRPGITGTLGLGNGGTGATSASAARTNLGIGSTSLYSGSLTTGSITFAYGDYSAYVIKAKPATNSDPVITIIPKSMITTTATSYQMADNQYWVGFKISYSGTTVTLTHGGGSSGNAIQQVHGII